MQRTTTFIVGTDRLEAETFHDDNSLLAVSEKNQIENYLLMTTPTQMADRI